MALLLGVAGIYGVMSYSVSQRTREIGIRMALGARNEEVTRMFVAHGARLAAVGIGCGLDRRGGADALHVLAAVRREARRSADLRRRLRGARAAAVLASYVPALRATSVDPVQALRAESIGSAVFRKTLDTKRRRGQASASL